MKTMNLFAAVAIATLPVAAYAIALPAKTYVMKAGASDMFEIESSKLVQNSSNPQVVQFANKMIADHTQSTQDVMNAAQADGLPPMTPMMTPKQKGMLDALKRTSGANRDRAYEKDQLMGHKEAIAFTKEYAMSGDKPNLKAAAQKILPIIQGHLQMAESMTPAGAKGM